MNQNHLSAGLAQALTVHGTGLSQSAHHAKPLAERQSHRPRQAYQPQGSKGRELSSEELSGVGRVGCGAEMIMGMSRARTGHATCDPVTRCDELVS